MDRRSPNTAEVLDPVWMKSWLISVFTRSFAVLQSLRYSECFKSIKVSQFLQQSLNDAEGLPSFSTLLSSCHPPATPLQPAILFVSPRRCITVCKLPSERREWFQEHDSASGARVCSGRSLMCMWWLMVTTTLCRWWLARLCSRESRHVFWLAFRILATGASLRRWYL